MKKNISDLKDEKARLLKKLKNIDTAKKKAFWFASHYAYLDRRGTQILVIILSLMVGTFLVLTPLGVFGLIIPYLLWTIYDLQRMDKLVDKYNESYQKSLDEVNRLIDEHMQVKNAIEQSLGFIKKFKLKVA